MYLCNSKREKVIICCFTVSWVPANFLMGNMGILINDNNSNNYIEDISYDMLFKKDIGLLIFP